MKAISQFRGFEMVHLFFIVFISWVEMTIKRKSFKNDFNGLHTGGTDVTLQTCSESSALLKTLLRYKYFTDSVFY